MIYGDYLDGTSWQSVLEDCQALVNEINAASSNAAMIHLPDLGIYGNSHDDAGQEQPGGRRPNSELDRR
jgi:hypothetical protein